MKKLYLLLATALLINISNAQNKAWGDTTYVDSIKFDSQCLYFSIDTSAQNIWQIGEPSQLFLDSAYSPVHAIMTDTANNYPINNHSYFDLEFINWQNPFVQLHYSVGIKFKHKFDTDSLKDGGFISVSYDNRQTWTNIIDDNNEPYCMHPRPWNDLNLYSNSDSLVNSNYGYSGNSLGWITTTFSWNVCMVKDQKLFSDTMIVRFNFISDSVNTNKEGWLIDDINLFWKDLGTEITDINNNNNLSIYPNPTTGLISITDDRLQITSIEVFDIYGKHLTGFENLSGLTEIDLSQEPKGIYIIKLRTSKGVAVEKIVLE